MPVQVVLYEPEIPPNTGNIIRLCANTGARLHLVEPMGFSLDDAKLKRAGLDYHEWTRTQRHENLKSALDSCRKQGGDTIWAFSTRAKRSYSQARFAAGDVLLFGPETRGLPDNILTQLGPAGLVRIPMAPQSRSQNLANSVAVALYEGWRQLDFATGV